MNYIRISVISIFTFLIIFFAFYWFAFFSQERKNHLEIKNDSDCRKTNGDSQFKRSEEWTQDGKEIITYTYFGCFIRIKSL